MAEFKKKTAEPRVNELIGAGLFWFNINGLCGLFIAQICTYFVCIGKEQRTLRFLCLLIWNITTNSSSSIQKLIGLWCSVVFSWQWLQGRFILVLSYFSVVPYLIRVWPLLVQHYQRTWTIRYPWQVAPPRRDHIWWHSVHLQMLL